MNKILKITGISALTIVIFISGLYSSESLHNIGFFVGKVCDIFGSLKYDMLDKSCYHAFCCEPVVAYVFYLTLLIPVSFFLFSKKQKLPAILFTAFGIGLILGTFIFYLVMP